MKPLFTRRGQILIPGLGLFFVGLIAFAGLFTLGTYTLAKMRLQTAAQAAALSAARAQAHLLNKLSARNQTVNRFVPVKWKDYGEILAKDIPAFSAWAETSAQMEHWGFLTYPPHVGRQVAKQNGATGLTLFTPTPAPSLLIAKPLYLLYKIPVPPFVAVHYVEKAYFARAWKPTERKAQPPHRTTWMVRRGMLHAAASAGLYLDIAEGNWLHNGGFPRTSESVLGNFNVQSFYPFFNARLLPQPVTPLARLWNSGWDGTL